MDELIESICVLHTTSLHLIAAPILIFLHVVVQSNYTVAATHSGQARHLWSCHWYGRAFLSYSLVGRQLFIWFTQYVGLLTLQGTPFRVRVAVRCWNIHTLMGVILLPINGFDDETNYWLETSISTCEYKRRAVNKCIIIILKFDIVKQTWHLISCAQWRMNEISIGFEHLHGPFSLLWRNLEDLLLSESCTNAYM